MIEDSSLFSLSKISINDLLVLREKRHENRIENAKLVGKPSNSEENFIEGLKKRIETNRICLGVNIIHDSILNNSFVLSNKQLSSNKNKRSLYTGAIVSKENIHLNQMNSSIISEQRTKINNVITEGNNTHILTHDLKIRKNRFVTKKNLTGTKIIWDSIQENIKSIVSPNE
ncbi:uncharacterized protein cubi_00610 [Cryptosporidium ubiquitum]|uniref:Uncharacterized protein n=1 Tax=Cryptosporidium ubiquitum TaxID=857276 RepID=A0A1J4MEB3_9CRYT|nr:uncharacterized protein cubi_00610 [Cryptosporidium ubiquitum]OII71803.1 hypothetical protein cubi_00610 [Cryptosporidium ubiquitum]